MMFGFPEVHMLRFWNSQSSVSNLDPSVYSESRILQSHLVSYQHVYTVALKLSETEGII